MKVEGKFNLSLFTAALLLTGAAVLTHGVQRGKTRPAAGGPGAVPAATPAPKNNDALAAPTPAKANRREASSESSPTPSPTAPPAKKNAARPGEGAKAGANSDTNAARYTYEFTQPDFHVNHILIEHDAAGRGQMTFTRKDDREPITDPVEISPAALARIGAAWEALKFLDSQESYQSEKQFPHLGTMRLGLRRGGRERTAEFNWTDNEHAKSLIAEYRRLGEQQLFVFDITLARQYQPSEAVKIFKRLEILLERDEISDREQLAPLLRDLTTDERIPLMARNHAERLLKKIEKSQQN